MVIVRLLFAVRRATGVDLVWWFDPALHRPMFICHSYCFIAQSGSTFNTAFPINVRA